MTVYYLCDVCKEPQMPENAFEHPIIRGSHICMKCGIRAIRMMCENIGKADFSARTEVRDVFRSLIEICEEANVPHEVFPSEGSDEQ